MAKGKYHEWLTEEGLLKLEGWARDGLTDEQIADNMGISAKTLYRWKEQHSQICQTLKKGKDVVDTLVENALLKRALGYTYTEVTRERIKDTGQKARHESGIELTEQQWDMCKAYFSNVCAYCGQAKKLTKDHLNPLNNGGELNALNVVPACGSCNSSKKDNNWLSWYQKQDFYDKGNAKKIHEYITFVSLLPQKVDNGELVITKEVVKEVTPDTTAQIFWLKNRRPDKWRDVKKLDVDGQLKTSNPFSDLTTEELRRLIKDG